MDLKIFFSLFHLRQCQQRSLTRHSSFHPAVSKSFPLSCLSDCHPVFHCLSLTRETLLFFWDFCFRFYFCLDFVGLLSSVAFATDRLTIERFHVHGHLDGLIVISVRAFNDLLAILHRDGPVADLLELVTLTFFSFGLMSFCCLGSLCPTFWFALSPPLALLNTLLSKLLSLSLSTTHNTSPFLSMNLLVVNSFVSLFLFLKWAKSCTRANELAHECLALELEPYQDDRWLPHGARIATDQFDVSGPRPFTRLSIN